ncbi:hypothetical protein VVD49_01075 [Uliginosibacterium sp. H3]|uniref:Uncharacterized protein n=1 Tax=Uliginosibacterium silvisoli TaxID=3114758 RepID=A0ABU6JZ94_9RHOO|nr:hypothetical protein [Uliginosibacterium sp. H3]
MNPTKPEQTASPEPAKMSDARRKLIRAGLASGPVVATLASPAVFATDCVAPSQTLSAAKSHGTTQLGNCSTADSCDTWKSKLGNTNCSAQEAVWRDTLFHNVFTQQGSASGCRMYKTTSGGAAPMSFYEVLSLSNSTTGIQVARQFVAAYLNVCAGKVKFPVDGIASQAGTAQAVVAMWSEWATKNSYTPYAGASAWDGSKVSHYLTYFVPKV